MGGDRRARTTLPIQEKDLVALTRKSILTDDSDKHVDDDPLADWAEQESSTVATGSQPQALPTTSRTATLADPLTTGLLAEVARRAATTELDPSAVAVGQRNTQEINPDVLAEVLRHAERTPTPEPNVLRKRTTTKK